MSTQIQAEDQENGITPLPLSGALLLFGIPAAAMILAYHFGIPFFMSLGISAWESFLSAQVIPLALLLAASLLAYHKIEGRPLTWQALRERFRYPKLTFKAFLQGIGVFILATIAYGALTPLSMWLRQSGLTALPSGTIIIDQLPYKGLTGNWELAALYFVVLAFNIVGEELWWRGYILPRQELIHGSFTWLVHGLLWWVFHIFKWWDLIGLLPVTLLLSYVSQRTQNNWPAFIAHYLLNGLGFLFVLGAVLDVI
jgi:membrane protease YdiL (CAAX protease family)